MKIRMFTLALCVLAFGCSRPVQSGTRLIPAEEFSKSVRNGEGSGYSIFRAQEAIDQRPVPEMVANQDVSRSATFQPQLARAALSNPAAEISQHMAADGLRLKGSIRSPANQIPETHFPKTQFPATQFTSDGDVAGSSAPPEVSRQLPYPPQLPPGSSSPYAAAQMTGNPSLWPDEAQGATYFTDFRAFQSMDVITIIINEKSEGNKKTKTDTEGSFDVMAGISALFGIETKKWVSNNTALDPAELISATSETKFEGEGETKREGKLKAQISAVILEVLPNGLLRIEGSKIVSVDSEEEVMVLSGLVRLRDINSQNEVDSNRIANMRIDFYGRGVLAEQQQPGWGARIFEAVWPF